MLGIKQIYLTPWPALMTDYNYSTIQHCPLLHFLMVIFLHGNSPLISQCFIILTPDRKFNPITIPTHKKAEVAELVNSEN